MWSRRIIYLLLLAAAFLLWIFNTHYLAGFCFWVVLAAPVLSLALSLPTLLTYRLTLCSVPPDAVRGESGQWEIAVKGGGSLPVAQISFTLLLRHSADGREEKVSRMVQGVAPRERWVVAQVTERCEAVEAEIISAWAADLLRLFALPIPLPRRQTMLVLPISKPPKMLPRNFGTRTAQSSAARPGQRLGEEYELRSYRPGDPIRSVHWKLSSKRDELIVRESSRLLRPTVLLTADRFGTPEETDAILDRLMGWSETLLQRDIPHIVQWVHPVTGELRTHRITERRQQRPCMEDLLRDPSPIEGKTVRDIPLNDRWHGEPVYPIHVGPGEEAEYEEA